MIRCSIGTAKVLGLKSLKIDALPSTAYLMVGEECKFNCAFCTQARDSQASSNMLSRVVWPKLKVEEVIKGLHSSEAQNVMQRICFQVVQDNKALEETKSLVKQMKKEHPHLPICVSAGPRSLEEIKNLLEQGVDRVSLALDAATPQVFTQTKDGSWERRYELLVQAASEYPGRIGTHLIVGLGESEEEMVKVIQAMDDKGITVALFAFTPVKGTRMENWPRPDLKQYRRIQTAHYLIRNKYTKANDFKFEKGRIISFGLSQTDLKAYLATGEAFQTSGCSGCNRPYYNDSPGEELYNYPRPLNSIEIERCWEQVCADISEK